MASLNELYHAKEALDAAAGGQIYSKCDISTHAAAVHARDALNDAIKEIEELRKTLLIYATQENWRDERIVVGHGETALILRWQGPVADRAYSGATKGPEYAIDTFHAWCRP